MSSRSFRGIRVMRFEDFELDLRAGELRHGPEKVRLQEQPYRILTMLLEHPGEVVLRDEICKRLWPNGTIVEVSHGINAAVQRLRDALGDSALTPRFVETVARRGYRFVAPVQIEYRRAAPARTVSPAPIEEFSLGQSISHFRLEERLGSGAMGIVYRAEDLNLNRKVALKFLTPETAGDPHAVGRFQREARTASALNHPNICTVYAVEEIDGQPAIVMELLEGRTLESMLANGPLTVAEALTLSIQMAAALDAAQRKGIVHRDLKPGNVMVTEFGVKVLDFGLAKQTVAGPASRTQTGSIAGTPNYMAPELFQGREADPRSDLYSFGVVLQEMLTGSAGRGELPVDAADLRPVIRRALESDPDNRWQTAGDLKAALEAVSAARLMRPAGRPAAPRWIGQAATAALAAVLLGWFATTPRRDPAGNTSFLPQLRPMPAASMSAHAQPSRPSTPGRFNLSPDGKLLAYCDRGDILVRGIDETSGRVVASLPGTSGTPFWSPDGRSLAFTNNRHLFTVSVSGGAPRQIGDVNTNIAGAWGSDGTILIGEIGGGLMGIGSSGGTARKVTVPDAALGETRHLMPQFLPDGRHFLYVVGSDRPDESGVYAGSLDSDKHVRIAPINSGATFIRQAGSKGYLVFEREGQVMAQKFDAASLRLAGDAIRLGGPVSGTRAASATGITVPEMSVTRTVLAYHRVQSGPLVSLVSMMPQQPEIVVLKNWMKELSTR